VNQESESEDRNCNIVPSSKDFTAFMRWFSGAFVVKAESYRWRPKRLLMLGKDSSFNILLKILLPLNSNTALRVTKISD